MRFNARLTSNSPAWGKGSKWSLFGREKNVYTWGKCFSIAPLNGYEITLIDLRPSRVKPYPQNLAQSTRCNARRPYPRSFCVWGGLGRFWSSLLTFKTTSSGASKRHCDSSIRPTGGRFGPQQRPPRTIQTPKHFGKGCIALWCIGRLNLSVFDALEDDPSQKCAFGGSCVSCSQHICV